MAYKIIMPKTGMAMEEGIILEWFKNEGDKVEKGEVIAEIETDKSTMELESDYTGVLLKILYPAGTTVAVVKTIAWIGETGEEIPEETETVTASVDRAAGVINQPSGKAAGEAAGEITGQGAHTPEAEKIGGRIKATPAARRAASERNINLASVVPGGRYGEIREADVLDAPKVPVTPLAARIAADQQIPLSRIPGSGHDGKIFKSDLSMPGNASLDVKDDFIADYNDKYVELTGIQKITGKRMLRSHMEIPGVTENSRADVTELMSIRKSLNNSLEGAISVNDFVMLATAKALRSNPRMNSSLEGDRVLYNGRIHLGMAVATPKGLVVPVIRDADLYSITGFSHAAKEIARKGRSGKLQPDEMVGGTFTVSNVGMYGITSFTPIINQPQAGILGVCAIEDELKMIDSEIVNRKFMGLSLTFDHRIVDGAEAAVFLKTLKDFLEAPLTILA